MGNFLAGAGLFLSTAAACGAMLWAPSRRRSAAMLIALMLIPILIVGDQWHSPEVSDLRHHVLRFAALGVAAAAVVGGLAVAFRHMPVLLPLALLAALPFRVPLHAGGQEVNLLIPLYLVIAAGALAIASGQVDEVRRRPELLPKVLAAVLGLYALQSVYSEDFSRALQNVAFFYVPFALAFAMLADFRWDRRLLALSLGVVAAEALVFVLFGFWEYASRHLIWNQAVIQSNDFHTYFRINSLFWDPNVYGRYLVLTIVALVTVMLWQRASRRVLLLAGFIALLWIGLVTTFSQSSFAALLAGLAVVAALRWSLRWTAIACASAALGATALVLAAGGSLKIDLSTQHKLNKDTSGRANLVSEGIALFGDRPLWGYGSGSFSVAYRQHRTGGSGHLSESHTEPVTVAAEQGVIGLAAYLALLIVAFATLLRGMRDAVPGLRAPPSAGGVSDAIPSARSVPSTVGSTSDATGPAAKGLGLPAARSAILACFVALVAHTMGYAGFLEDPFTWVLLSVGGALALEPDRGGEREQSADPGAVPPEPARAAA